MGFSEDEYCSIFWVRGRLIGHYPIAIFGCSSGQLTSVLLQTSIHSSADAAAGVVAHFVANMEERVSALKFNNNSSLLLVCGGSGQQFNLFSILPHPSSPVLGAVHHLYTLHRGNTNAKVRRVGSGRGGLSLETPRR